MGDDHDGAAGGVQVTQQRDDLGGGARVEIPGGLVGQQDRRMPHQRTGDGDTLAFAARQLRGTVAGPAAQADTFEHVGGALTPLGNRHRLVQQAGCHIVERVEPCDQVELLEHEADALAAQRRDPSVGQPAEPLAFHRHLARAGPVERAHHVQHRALARTRRPGHRHQIAAADRQIDACQRMHRLRAPVRLGHPAEAQHLGGLVAGRR